MSKEAIEHYEAALKEAFPRGATGDVFHHWNEARKALEKTEKQEPPVVAELLCVCGCEWEWRNRDWELMSTPPAAPVQEPVAWYDEEYDCAYTAAELDGGNVDGLLPLYTTPPAAPVQEPDLQAELDATNRQVEILSDALAESRREVAAQRQWVGLTDQSVVSAAARVLSDRVAASCNVDCGDMWMLHGNDSIEDARAMLEAAEAKLREKNGGQA